jgi:hypothetical protein
MLFLLTAALLSPQQVAITEFQADNDVILEDFDGDRSDWIELHNYGTTQLDLSGWALTDDAGLPLQWQLPSSTKINAGKYLLVFASGKDRAVAGEELHTNFKLAKDGDYLALVQPSGQIHQQLTPTYPQQFEDVSYGLSFDPAITQDWVYFQTPTPGAKNGVGGPVVHEIESEPEQLLPGQDLTVTVEMEAETPALLVDVSYRVGYQAEQWLSARDDGSGGDAVAGDQIWTAVIPGGVADPGKMLRWSALATNAAGGVNRYPGFHAPENSPEYQGTMVLDATVTSPLPIYHWFVENPGAANTWAGTRASMFYDGDFYDNIYVRKRGGSSAFWSKKSFKFDFNRGHHFRFADGFGKVEEFNLNTTWSDKAYMRRLLCWQAYREAGLPASLSFPVQLRRKGKFYQLTAFVEQVDKHMLERYRWDEEHLGALYKMYNVLDNGSGGVEKKTRHHESNDDLRDFVQGLRLTGADQRDFVFDNVDVPSVINYIAVTNLLHNNDHIAKNYYVYRDSEGDLEWQFLAWDMDLTLGRNYTIGGGVLNDTIWAENDPYSHPDFGDRDHRKNDGPWNRLIDAILQQPETHELYLRRLRSVMDQLLQEPGTPRADRWFEQRMDEWVTSMSDDVALDVLKWGIPSYGTQQDFLTAVGILENDYLQRRRVHFYLTHGPTGSGLIPARQKLAPQVGFGIWEDDPSSGLQAEEYLQLLNLEATAIDVSGWSVTGDVSFTFEAGTVIGAQNVLYLSPNQVAFRSRLQSPTGGESHLVVGPAVGDLPAQPQLTLLDQNGDLVATTIAGPQLVVRNLIAGEKTVVNLVGGTAGGDQMVGYSLTGAGPTTSPWGSLSLSQPIYPLATQIADGFGTASWQIQLPAGIAGTHVWLQGYDLVSGELTPGIQRQVQ